MLPGALAFDLPFGIAKLFASTIAPTTITGHIENVPSPISKIAVIGAGAAGSSAAFWLSKARARLGVNFEIDVYESGGYIGGRECLSSKHRDLLIEKKIQVVLLYTLMTTLLFLSLNSEHLYLLKQIEIYGELRTSSTSRDAISRKRVMELLFGMAKI